MNLNNLPHGDMPQDFTIPKEEYVPGAKKLLDLIRPDIDTLTKNNEKIIITLSGGSGSGKSTTASLLGGLLEDEGHHVYIMSGDNYPWRIPEENDAMRMQIYESKGRPGLCDYLGTDQELDYGQVNRLLQGFKSREAVLPFRRLGKTKEEDWHEDVDVSGTDILILEWTHANSPFVHHKDISIYMDSTPEATLSRRIERGRNDNAASDFIAMVLDIEQDKLIDQSKHADYIVPFGKDPLKADLWQKQAAEKEASWKSRDIKPMLNAYPDSIDHNLTGLAGFLNREELKDVFGSLYILPSLYHSDLDRGFCVQDYDLEESLACEEDLEAIRKAGIDLKLDFVLNHASAKSPQFLDLVKNGKDSEYYDFFLNWNDFWKDHGTITEEGCIQPDAEYLKDMFFRKPGLPLMMVEFEDGTKEPYWNTFYQKTDMDPETGKPVYLGQMDLDVRNEKVWKFYEKTLNKLKSYGASLIRLDAFAYASKVIGKPNFLNEPETWDILERVDGMAKPLNLKLLPEIHEAYNKKTYKTIGDKGYMTYDFFLPGLILDAIENKNASHIAKWGQEILDLQLETVNMLGCHDGIPMLDLKGILDDKQIEDLIDTILGRGGIIKNLHGQKNVYYQVNATYYSALGEDENKMLLARAIQLFMPGKPQVWYLDLLGGTNDYEAVKAAGADGHKEINRSNYSREQMETALSSSLVQKQLELIRLRNTHPAFSPESEISISSPDASTLIIEWKNPGQASSICLEADLANDAFTIR